ncbi:MAG: hypothetical protein MI892_24485, partial [Desulfobacterales bacterium]|nr:hypothetical protein [Desulfobacterales bacterium]
MRPKESGVSDGTETPPSYIANSLSEASKHPLCSPEHPAKAFEEVYASIRPSRNGQGSLPCSMPP